jgi:hypothetical protein
VKDFEKPAVSPLAVAPSAGPPVPEWARRLSVLLDSAIQIPGTNLRIGLDPILGALLPELGDALTAVLSLTLVGVAFRQRVPRPVLARMLINILFDALLGAVPVLGDVFDFAFKANEKNLALLERHRGDPSRPATAGDWLVIAGVALAALVCALVPIVVGVALLRWLASVMQ